MDLSILLALALVASATVSVWQVVSHGADEALQIAGMCVAVLLLGAALQLIAWGGMLIGAVAATALGLIETRHLVDQRPWLHERLERAASGAAARLALQDRADFVTYRHSLPRRAAEVTSLTFLMSVGVMSVLRGLRPDSRVWLFLGCLILFLPIAQAVGGHLRRVERRQLSRRLGRDR